MSIVNNILVPTDFSESGQLAFEYACEFAAQADAKLHLIHVTGDGSLPADRESAIRGKLETKVTQSRLATSKVNDIIKEVIAGEPYQVILDYVRKHRIDLIVMGTHGRTGLAHFVVGSVAERVIRDAPCPVLVLGPRDQQRSTSLRTAVQAIREVKGHRFEASYTSGGDALRALLRERLELPEGDAHRLLERLEQQGSLVWTAGEPGTWSVSDTVTFTEEPPTILTASQPASQAVELITRARQLRATDVHLDPTDDHQYLVRLRIDGRLQPYCRLDAAIGLHLVNQLKTMSNINIAEPFGAKESRVRLPRQLADVEVRITSAPVSTGEATALRIFARDNIYLPLNNLGLTDRTLEAVEEMLRLGEGLVLATGPTGAGKSTTIYAMLAAQGGMEKNIVSIEDPVELSVPFARQMNVDPRHGITMTGGLRTLLRMDPDVVFLGEIRDAEAAQIAMQAANSGRYVLTTLHTRDVASTVTALRDMNISDRSIAGNLTGIINQRLVRRLCPECKVRRPLTQDEQQVFREAGVDVPDMLSIANGCETCRYTGFRGRIGVFEVALCRGDFEIAVADGATEQDLKALLRSQGVVSLRTDSLSKAAAEITSLEEAMTLHWLR